MNTTIDNMQNDDDLLALEKILIEVSEPVAEPTKQTLVPSLREDHTFAEAFGCNSDVSTIKNKETLVAKEVDSSDDEDIANFLERKYNEYGGDINKQLKQQRNVQHEEQVERAVKSMIKDEAKNSCHIKNPHNPVKRYSQLSSSIYKPLQPAAAVNTFIDPTFGFRIINPLVSSSMLLERMNGRKSVSFAHLAFYTQQADLTQDWVIAGVIVSKNPVRMTKKGDPFSIWRLSDLRGDIKMVSLFLFGGAHKELWKTPEGMVLALLNPNVLEKRTEGGDIASLSIDTAKKVMILGKSKDLGTCRAKKRNGETCNAVVNLTECETCIFHMKQEYGKMSRRSELQSSSLGRGLNELRNKVLGKSEVFYGGQSFTAIPAKKSAKLMKKDMDRLSLLSEYAVSPFAREQNHTAKSKFQKDAVPYAQRDGHTSKIAGNLEIGTKQRLKDLERLKELGSSPTAVQESKNDNSADNSTSIKSILSKAVPEKFKNREFSFNKSTPSLSSENFSLEVNINPRQADWSKQKALAVLKSKPLEKVNPNSVRGSQEGKRRAIDELNTKFTSSSAKRQKLEAEKHEAQCKSRLERIMAATSSHSNLIAMRENEDREKYFNKLEKKEALEEKMLQTFKMPCKAVICLQCKYTAFSAADRCKEQKHALKVVDAQKRFFKCRDCGNRTATVFKLPKTSCSNCKGSHWERAAMIRERKVCDGSEGLSIRGDEETFIGSSASSANLNLLVPSED